LTAKAEPGWATSAFTKLDASHGRQDHTVLPYATTSLVLRGKQSLTARRPPCDLPRAQRRSRPLQPALHVSWRRVRPSSWGGMAQGGHRLRRRWSGLFSIR